MKIHGKVVAFAIMSFLAAPHLVAQLSDTSPPKLVEFEISPATIEISTTNQIITLTARTTDDLSGFRSSGPFGRSLASVGFRPDGADYSVQGVDARFMPGSPISGNAFDGVYKAELFVPAHSRTGVWTVVSFVLIDDVGNGTNLIAADLRALGLPISFTVTGVEDRNPPDIVSLSLEPTTVDTSTAGGSIKVTARILEDFALAGGYDLHGPLPATAIVDFLSPSKLQIATARLFQMSGDDHDSMFSGTLYLPQFSETGIWRLQRAQITDAAGNTVLVGLGAALAHGMTAEITVTGIGDTSPPTLRSFDFTPRWIGLPTKVQSIGVTTRFTDDLGGLVAGFDDRGAAFPGTAFVEFRSPSGRQSAGIVLFGTPNQTGMLDVTFSSSLSFPKFCETGVWTVSSVSTKDGLGNRTQLDARMLRNLGYPTEIAVGILPPLAVVKQENSILLSWPAWGEDFHLQSRGLDDPAWTTVQTPPALIDDQVIISVPLTPVSQLFRLAQ